MNHIHKRCAYLSNLIYNPLMDTSSEENETFIIDNNKIAIITENNINYVIIQGSNDLEDWIINFQFSKTKKGYHSGFIKSSVKIESVLDKELDKNKKYVFTGHSMGGALALILGMKFNASSIVTFGQPKIISNNDFNYDINNIYRYITPEDIVPNTPPDLFGYKHIGHSYFILNDRITSGDMNFYDKLLYKIHSSVKDAINLRNKDHNLLMSSLWFLLSYVSLQGKKSFDSHSSEYYKIKLN
jgi:hypothetical protein